MSTPNDSSKPGGRLPGGVARSRLRGSKRIALSLAVVATVGSVATIGSWAAWTVTDANSANTFSTSSILLDDNQGGEGGTATATGTAMFNVTNMVPGGSATTACIGVDFTGTASSLTLTAALGGGGSAVLGPQLTMTTATYNTSGTVTITPGTNTNSGACTNYPAGGTNTTIGSQGSTLTAWSTASPYTISSPVTNTWYKFTVSGLPAGDTNCATYCAQTVTITLTWTLSAS